MARPTYVGAGAAQFTTVGTMVPPLPTGWAVDDIFFILWIHNNAASPPSGWAEVSNSPQNRAQSGATYESVFWRRAVAGDTAPTLPGAGNGACQCVAFRGCIATGTPFQAGTGGFHNTATTAYSSTGFTTTEAESLVCCFAGRNGDNLGVQWSGWAGSGLANVTERLDQGFSHGLGGGYAFATGEMDTAGAQGPITATLATSRAFFWIELALLPVVTVPAAAALAYPQAFIID